MFLLGSGLISLPSRPYGKVWLVSSPNAKASILEPADISNTFTIALEPKHEDAVQDAWRCCNAGPRRVKGGGEYGCIYSEPILA